MYRHTLQTDEWEGAQSHAAIMDNFRAVQTTAVVGGGKQFSHSERRFRDEREDNLLMSNIKTDTFTISVSLLRYIHDEDQHVK